LAKLLEIRVGPPSDALDRFEAAWNRRAEGRAMRTLNVLSVSSLPELMRAITPARWALLENLRDHGACSIYELAKRLGRDYKNVHTDVAELSRLGVVEKDPQGKTGVAWDAIRAELRF
jgi:predicted transcriptional regulator